MSAVSAIESLRGRLAAALRGREHAVEQAMVCMVASGHLLIEDVPGVGKTTLARAMAGAFALSFRRVQFTSDLLPADLLGVSIFDPAKSQFQFKPGPVFTNVLLADELNRATPRTQSALLEAMSEGQISAEDGTHALPAPFLVVATQNPVEHHGTFPLPESQLDRFLMRIEIGYPDLEQEKALLLSRTETGKADVATASPEALSDLQGRTDEVKIDEALADYMLRIVHRTREDADVELGISTRGILALKRASQGYAVIRGRNYVTPDDIQSACEPVLAHRLMLRRGEGAAAEKALYVRKLLEHVEVPI